MNLLENKKILEYVCLCLLLVCLIFSLSYPLLFRSTSGNLLFSSDSSYIILGQSHQPFADFFVSQSTLFSNSNSLAPFKIESILYWTTLQLLPSTSLPIILSFLTLILSWFLLKKLSIQTSVIFIALCMLVFSPLFISSQLILGPQIFFLIFTLLLYLVLRMHLHPVLCGLVAAILGLFGIDSILPFFLILVLIQRRKGFAPIVVHKRSATAGIIIGLVIWLIGVIFTGIPLHSLLTFSSLSTFFIEFGALSGQTFLLLLLALIGFIMSWTQEHRWALILSVALIIWSAFFHATSLLAAAVISYFAAKAFINIWRSEWQHLSLKLIVLVCIFAAVLTGYFISSQQLIDSPPGAIDLDAYEFLSQKTSANVIILSTPSQGPFISYFAHRSPFISSEPQNAQYENRTVILQKILFSKSLESALKELKANRIDYILLDPKTLKSQNWRPEKGGLALLIRNKSAFTLVYSSGYQIYRVNYDVQASK